MLSTEQLPIGAFRQRILESVDRNQVTIITAETGAGKSTQVPQYLVEHGYEKVIVTQPRILAARNLSLRVREEWLQHHHDAPDTTVAYRTAHERDDDTYTTILYCTDGLQLVREVAGVGTGARQVLVLDEIHEWNQNMEVLVAWAKKRCAEDPAFKVLVMSATIDAASLAAYFGAGVPITVPGRSFPISMKEGHSLIGSLEQVLYQGSHNILVFLPGKAEIESVTGRLSKIAETRNVPIIPLHSQLTAEEQQLAFASYPYGKVILSTNIAQTSITIDDIDVVIDSGLERRTEIQDGVEGLFIGQVSKADCLQRAGRAGRTKVGEYILANYDTLPCVPIARRQPYAIPEIMRTYLDRLVLRLASADIDIETLEFFHAPKPEAIRRAKELLVTLGAMTTTGSVTTIGRRMEAFPVESRYSRMLVEAAPLEERTRLKLAVCIAIQEVGGIVRGGAKNSGWRQFTSQSQSDPLAHYDVYCNIPQLDPLTLDDLGIIEKNVTKAEEVIERLAQVLGIALLELTSISAEEQLDLMRCIVAGQIDQIWMVGQKSTVMPLGGGIRRELSGGTVVHRAGLVSGTPFDLEVPTPFGLETLHFVQDVTIIDPRWLEATAPHLFSAKPDRFYFDSTTGGLSQYWILRTKNGSTIKGASIPVTEHTPQNFTMFTSLYSTWLHGQLEEDRIKLQKKLRHRLPIVPLHRVQEKAGVIAHGIISLSELPAKQCVALAKLASMRTYLEEGSPAQRAAGARKVFRHNDQKRRR